MDQSLQVLIGSCRSISQLAECSKVCQRMKAWCCYHTYNSPIIVFFEANSIWHLIFLLQCGNTGLQQQLLMKANKSTRKCWSRAEQVKYLSFLIDYKPLFATFQQRRKQKVFMQLSNHIKTRNSRQTKSHHQKMMNRFGQLDMIISYLREQIKFYAQYSDSFQLQSEPNQLEENVEKTNLSQLDFSQKIRRQQENHEQDRFPERTKEEKERPFESAFPYLDIPSYMLAQFREWEESRFDFDHSPL